MCTITHQPPRRTADISPRDHLQSASSGRLAGVAQEATSSSKRKAILIEPTADHRGGSLDIVSDTRSLQLAVVERAVVRCQSCHDAPHSDRIRISTGVRDSQESDFS